MRTESRRGLWASRSGPRGTGAKTMLGVSNLSATGGTMVALWSFGLHYSIWKPTVHCDKSFSARFVRCYRRISLLPGPPFCPSLLTSSSRFYSKQLLLGATSPPSRNFAHAAMQSRCNSGGPPQSCYLLPFPKRGLWRSRTISVAVVCSWFEHHTPSLVSTLHRQLHSSQMKPCIEL